MGDIVFRSGLTATDGIMRKRAVLRYAVFMAICLAPWRLSAGPGNAAISIITSYSIEQHKEAIDGFKNMFRANKVPAAFFKHTLEKAGEEKIREEIRREKPDVIFAVGSNAAEFATAGFPDIPVVFCLVLEPEKLISSSATGITMDIAPEAKLETAKKLIPGITAIGMFYSAGTRPEHKRVSAAGRPLNLKVFAAEINPRTETAEALKNLASRIDCFLMIPDSEIFFMKSVENLFFESLKNRIPVIGLSSSFTRAGALFSLECDYADIGRQAGETTLRILGGKKPSEIPLRSPAKTALSINMTVARRLGIYIGPEIRESAQEIFE